MPRESRVVAVGIPHHITQRGNARQDVFTSDSLRRVYLDLLAEHSANNRLRILAYCLMTNHVHIVAVPTEVSSMANTFRHAHGRFSQSWNTLQNRSGHVWQNRFYSCPVEEAAIAKVTAYVEGNPVRARMVKSAEDFEWSSARAHLGKAAGEPILDMEWWRQRWTPENWRRVLADQPESAEDRDAIRRATFMGRPLGSLQFVSELEERLGRILELRRGGRGRKKVNDAANQLQLWNNE